MCKYRYKNLQSVGVVYLGLHGLLSWPSRYLGTSVAESLIWIFESAGPKPNRRLLNIAQCPDTNSFIQTGPNLLHM